MNTGQTIRINTTRAEMDLAVSLWVTDCGGCGVIFAIPDRLHENRRDNPGSDFYCPNGHSLVFREDEKARLQRELKWANDALASERAAHEQAQKSLSATRGVVTRMKRRAMAGACPFGCHRTFKDLQRHIVSKHPDETTEGVGV